ncbi:hypothetical protein JAO29_15190 [Edaphobacter sp. HDX4]|uniref:hypothetical protein n=1 Tax=Edaphobacter sp. HDX4 TaxID=2794064 RepID=UPI002FE5C713
MEITRSSRSTVFLIFLVLLSPGQELYAEPIAQLLEAWPHIPNPNAATIAEATDGTEYTSTAVYQIYDNIDPGTAVSAGTGEKMRAGVVSLSLAIAAPTAGAFSIGVDPTPVPESPTLLLIGVGLIVFAEFQLRRSAKRPISKGDGFAPSASPRPDAEKP